MGVIDEVDVDLARMARLGTGAGDAMARERVNQAGFTNVRAANEGDLG